MKHIQKWEKYNEEISLPVRPLPKALRQQTATKYNGKVAPKRNNTPKFSKTEQEQILKEILDELETSYDESKLTVTEGGVKYQYKLDYNDVNSICAIDMGSTAIAVLNNNDALSFTIMGGQSEGGKVENYEEILIFLRRKSRDIAERSPSRRVPAGIIPNAGFNQTTYTTPSRLDKFKSFASKTLSDIKKSTAKYLD